MDLLVDLETEGSVLRDLLVEEAVFGILVEVRLEDEGWDE